MKLTDEQDQALVNIQRWLAAADQPEHVLAGYAGTGKTTLLQHFINNTDKVVLCCAPTGKAASVLRKKLSNGAKVSTVHSALYDPVQPSTAKLESIREALLRTPEDKELQEQLVEEETKLSKKNLRFSVKDSSLIVPGQLVIIDEASMVTKQMRKDLLATGALILYVGDPGQLPPVNDEGFFIKHTPDSMLVNVQRQALDSPIIRLSMQIRLDKPLDVNEECCRRMPKSKLEPLEWLRFDQVITGRNESRHKINRYFRKQLGYDTWWPNDGEKLICLKNEKIPPYHFINGIPAVATARFEYEKEIDEVVGSVLFEGHIVQRNMFDNFYFQVHYDSEAKQRPWQDRDGIREFDYAYAITVHKSQGSEWDSVLLADDEMQVRNPQFRKRWLYTAVTRAKKELVWLT